LLRTILINGPLSPEGELRDLVEASGIFLILRDLTASSFSIELQRSLLLEPEIVLLTVTAEATTTADKIVAQCPATIVISVGDPLPSATGAVAAHLGPELSPEKLFEALTLAVANRLSRSHCDLITFMPAKAGSGSSTVALNTAAQFAQTQRQPVLMIDADLRSSAVTALVGRTPRDGIELLFDKFDNMSTLDPSRALVHWHGVDLLMSTRSVDAVPPSAGHYFRLLIFAAGRYRTIIVDLPELVNPATVGVVCASHHLFVVCTPELPSLTLAKQRLCELERLTLQDDRIGIVVNRWHRTDPDHESLADMLGKTHIHTLPNDYHAVRKSFAEGAPVGDSKLASAFEDFAGKLMDPGAMKPVAAAGLKRFFRLSRSA
jgi:cellulose biosynthesis protein BcsQ